MAWIDVAGVQHIRARKVQSPTPKARLDAMGGYLGVTAHLCLAPYGAFTLEVRYHSYSVLPTSQVTP